MELWKEWNCERIKKVKEGKRKDRGKEVRERSKGRRKGGPCVKGRCVFMGRPKEKKERREG